MVTTVKEMLIKEYLRKCGYLETCLTACGFSRCQFKKGRLTEKSVLLKTCSFLFLSVNTLFMVYIFQYAENHEGFFLSSDKLMAYTLIIFSDVTMLEANLFGRGGTVQLYNYYYEIEEYLNVDDATFLRDLEYRQCFVFFFLSSIFAGSFISTLIFKFHSAPYTVGFSSISIIISLVGIGCDYINYTRLHLFLILRVRYFNLAMMKYSQTKLEYVDGSLMFNILSWYSKIEDRVSFQREAKPEDFVKMYRKLFQYYDCFKTCYSFQIFASVLQVIFGSILTVQLILDIFANQSLQNIFTARLAVLPLWNIFTWTTLSIMFSFTDIFIDQIEDSKRICCYILLKDDKGPALVMAESLIRSLNVRQSEFQLYGMFKIDSSLSLRALAAILVIIMALLQFTSPTTDKI